ncbi:DUF4176 domain-containing protein [Clostridium thermarum]|uniref:DUF4176 domain-containing protein n=1 Tax=Clostridium thermarum TaxID=1716543 RepID=UPI00111EAB79|nr:DUF4176 domain-containing protein [Clostridium thermarum]
MSEYLPIGSVVRLFGGTKKLMIYGRKQIQSGANKKWDYVGCLYPEGNLSEKYNVFFNHNEIEEIYFKGYEDDEEIYTKELLKNL